MGNMCSSKQQIPVDTPLSHSASNFADKVRDFARQVRILRQKLESEEDIVKDLHLQLTESETQDDKTTQLKTDTEKLMTDVNGVMEEIREMSQQITNVLDKYEQESSENPISQQDITTQEQSLKSFDTKISNITKQYNTISNQWKKYLVENDNSSQLHEELQQKLQRISQETINYEHLLADVGVQIDDLVNLLSLVLEDEIVKKDYEDKQESLQKHQVVISLNKVQYVGVSMKFATAMSKLKELTSRFQTHDKEQGSLEELEKINDDAKKFLEINKTLGADIMNLNKALTERREKLLDVDIQNNLSIKRMQFDAVTLLYEDIDQAITIVMRAIEAQFISAIDQQSISQLTPLKKEIEELSEELREKEQLLGQLNDQLNEEEKLVATVEAIDQLKIMPIKKIIPHITLLGQIGHQIAQLKNDFENIQQNLEIKKIMMGDSNVQQKVNDQSQRALEHQESINNMKEEIQTMLGLFSDLQEYASDDEESYNIKIIQQQVEQFREQMNEVEKHCQKTSIEVEDMINELQEAQDDKTNIGDLASRVGELDKQVNSNEKLVQEMTEKLEKRAQRFNEFDLKSKYQKRVKQLEEGKVYRLKVKNRSGKMIRKINEKEDLNLKEEQHQRLRELKELATQYKKKYEDESSLHDKLHNYMEKTLFKLIPNDPLSISPQDQIKLLRELKHLKIKLIENNTALLELRENLMKMQDEVHQIKEDDNNVVEEDYQLDDYVPQQNDQMDSLMSDYLNNGSKKVQIEIKRLGEGQYQFGSKKIITKVVNGKLTVKVGGGYMSVEEFVQTYAEKEMQKQMEREYEDLNSVNSFTPAGQQIMRKRTLAAQKQQQLQQSYTGGRSSESGSSSAKSGAQSAKNGQPIKNKI